MPRLAPMLLMIALVIPAVSFGTDLGVDSVSPIPEGYTSEEWENKIFEAMDNDQVIDVGGIEVVVLRLEAPFSIEGKAPVVKMVPLTTSELGAAALVPGDAMTDSVSKEVHIYYESNSVEFGDAEGGDPYGEVEAESLSSGGGALPLSSLSCTFYNYWCQIYQGCTECHGSGLINLTSSYIQLSGGASSSTMLSRKGSAQFYNDRSSDYGVESVTLPNNSFITTKTTYYAYMGWYNVGGYIVYTWIVVDPEAWVYLGENGWDNIRIKGDALVDTNPITLTHAKIQHNNEVILDSNINVTLRSSRTYRPLDSYIDSYRRALVYNSSDPFVLTAINEYGQSPDKDYPVMFCNNTQQPCWWCSEFGSWVARQGNPSLGQSGERIPEPYALMPVGMGGYPNWPNWLGSVSGTDLKAWADFQGRLQYFGDDSGVANGPTFAEWAALSSSVDPGDLVVRDQPDVGHTMVVVGWSDGSSISPSNFLSSRECNLLYIVGGNENADYGNFVIGRVQQRKEVVCRRPDPVTGFDPICGDLDGDGLDDNQCKVRLWDTATGNNDEEGGFFVNTD